MRFLKNNYFLVFEKCLDESLKGFFHETNKRMSYSLSIIRRMIGGIKNPSCEDGDHKRHKARNEPTSCGDEDRKRLEARRELIKNSIKAVPQESFDSVVGLDKVKEELEDQIIRPCGSKRIIGRV